MRRILVLVMVLLTGCSPVNPRVSLEESRAKRREEFKVDAAKNPAIMAAWNLKENLKKDYREIIGPSAAHDEKMDLLFSNALNEAMLRTPGQCERMAESWAKTRSDPVPTREEIQGIIKSLDGRIKTLDGVIAKEMQLAEEQAKEDAEQRKKIIQVIAGIALVALAVAGSAVAASSAYRPVYDSTAIGPYVITRNGPTTNVLTPSGRLYTCTTTGSYRLSVVNCF